MRNILLQQDWPFLFCYTKPSAREVSMKAFGISFNGWKLEPGEREFHYVIFLQWRIMATSHWTWQKKVRSYQTLCTCLCKAKFRLIYYAFNVRLICIRARNWHDWIYNLRQFFRERLPNVRSETTSYMALQLADLFLSQCVVPYQPHNLNLAREKLSRKSASQWCIISRQNETMKVVNN